MATTRRCTSTTTIPTRPATLADGYDERQLLYSTTGQKCYTSHEKPTSTSTARWRVTGSPTARASTAGGRWRTRDRREGHHVGERRLPLPHRQRRQDDGARSVLQLAAAPGAPRPGVLKCTDEVFATLGRSVTRSTRPKPSHDVLHVPRRRRPHPRRVQERRGDLIPVAADSWQGDELDEPPEGLRRQPRRHNRLAEPWSLLQPSWAGSRRHYGRPPYSASRRNALRRGIRRCDERAARLRPREAVRLPRDYRRARDVAQAAGDGRRLGRPVGAAHRGARRRPGGRQVAAGSSFQWFLDGGKLSTGRRA